jgi:hypothetical protein
MSFYVHSVAISLNPIQQVPRMSPVLMNTPEPPPRCRQDSALLCSVRADPWLAQERRAGRADRCSGRRAPSHVAAGAPHRRRLYCFVYGSGAAPDPAAEAAAAAVASHCHHAHPTLCYTRPTLRRCTANPCEGQRQSLLCSCAAAR